jgi:uncharacterized protein YjbI with pentapeptide repeats
MARGSVRVRGTAATLRGIEDRHERRGRPVRRWIAALAAATAVLAAAPAAAAAESPAASPPDHPAAATADPFVAVHAELKREAGGAVVVGHVVWDKGAAGRKPDYMSEGDLRLVAVSDHGHRPTVLGTETYDKIEGDPTQPVSIPIAAADEPAIAPGNRVVLTASQHGEVSQGTLTVKTYVTVDQLQGFGNPQDRIGRRDCSAEPIVPGANLNGCDLVGAFLERAKVSTRYPTATRMLLADLTGAQLQGANLTGLSVAGGRLNGADAAEAVFDNLSLAGAEATGLDARGATSDQREEAAGANFFDARLNDSNFHGAVLKGMSMRDSDLDGADFGNATWDAMEADTASFRGADLRGLKSHGSTVRFSDFTDTKLLGASLGAPELEWAKLCHTELPAEVPADLADRDCPSRVDPGPKPAADPFVTVEAGLERAPKQATIKGRIDWSASGAQLYGMSAGDIRVVAIDGSTGRPTTVGKVAIGSGLPASTPYEVTIEGDDLGALNPGNRVVLTATQHRPLVEGVSTNRSYVSVDTLQPGPGHGRVGSRDCSDLALTPTAPAPDGYDLCDLPGAVLTQAELSGPMLDVDLSGADLEEAGLGGIKFDGARLAGANLTRARLGGISLIAAFAPRLTLPETSLGGAVLRSADLDEADFEGSVISDSIFAAASLRRAKFSDAKLVHVDLAYTDLAGARLDHTTALSPDLKRPTNSSLFLADLSGATLADSHWDREESGDIPWQWATLCDTTLPADPGPGIDGNRDCPARR